MELSKNIETEELNMLSIDYTKDLLNLQGVIVDKIEHLTDTTIIHIHLPVKIHKCKCCGEITSYVHDYRIRTIKDISAFGKNVILLYKQRRYVCKHCGKRFAEDNSFSPKYYRITQRLFCDILKKLENEYSFTKVAMTSNLSVSTVIRYFDMIAYQPPEKLPNVIAIDEFKGNTGDEKYQAIITDPQNGIVLDILADRKTSHLISYVKRFEQSNRLQVKYFVSDMWKPYAELADTYFKNATPIVDKYHYIRQIIWAFERVRKNVQKNYGKANRLLFKHSKRILTMRNSKLEPSQREKVEHLLYLSDDLRSAYYLKEKFYEVIDCTDSQQAKKLMQKWLLSAESSRLAEYNKCAETIHNWAIPILNTFDCTFTNGFTEGCNNKIKVLKRNAYGYRNFDRFRNRILHMFNYKKQKKAAA